MISLEEVKDNFFRKAWVKRVIDGDTFEAEVDLGYHIKITEKFRLKDIDTPEIYKANSQEERREGYRAREFVEKLIWKKVVWIKSTKTGKYGRYLAEVFLPYEGSIGELSNILKESGFAKDREGYGAHKGI
jgi:micrococcal nuclease